MKNAFDIVEYFKELNWPSLKIDQKNRKVTFDKNVIYEEDDNYSKLYFYKHSIRDNLISTRYKYLKCITVEKSSNLEEILYITQYQYQLSYYNLLNSILGLSNNEIKSINILKKYKNIKIDKTDKIINISPDKFQEIFEEAKFIYNKTKKYKNSIENYLTNKALTKFGFKNVADTTYIEKGEFTFLIKKLNLKTKKSGKDFLGYIDDEDIKALENLTERMIKKEVFSEDFFRKLDEYFIKEKLQHILKIGNEILQLKKEDIKTEKAKTVYKKYSKEKIKQMENMWQIFFKNYLLYLIFSYKKIKPKIKLKGITGKKKFPDFLGINHYDGIDIIEIKTHLKNALVWDSNHDNFAFSGDLSKAIIQTMNYMEAVKREAFQDTGDLDIIKEDLLNSGNLYNPRGIIIISSKDKLAKGCQSFDLKKTKQLEKDFTKLRNSLHNIEIITFDEILNVAKNYTENIMKEFKK